MWASLDQLRDDLQVLRHYIDGLDKQDRVLAFEPSQCGAAEGSLTELHAHFRSSNRKAQYEYNTIVVSLYGHFERFIEELVVEYVKRAAALYTAFDELPDSIKANHLVLSLDLVRKAESRRYSGVIRVDELIARVNSCFASPAAYELNVRAFAQHTANVRQEVIAHMCGRCGIGDLGPALRSAEPFVEFLKREDQDRDVARYMELQDSVLFFRLEDLADRRNDVSHGSGGADILSREIVRSYIDFIEAYATGLGSVLFEKYLPLTIPFAQPLGAPITVIDGRIVCVDLPSGELAVGDILIAETREGQRPFRGGVIRRLERDRIAVDRVDGGADVKVGIEVDFAAKRNHRFFRLNRGTFDQ
jgi:hypothetical protein